MFVRDSERVTSSPRDAAAVATRMEEKTAAGFRTTKRGLSHRFHVYMDRVLSNAGRMPRSWYGRSRLSVLHGSGRLIAKHDRE
jgi:hypothetical protein